MKRTRTFVYGGLGGVLVGLGIFLRNPVFSFGKIDFPHCASSQNLKSHVQTILKKGPRNYLNLDVLDGLATYIEQEFSQYCDNVERQTYQVDGNDYYNIICHFQGNSSRLSVIGAHYDVAGNQDGADDNASGIAGIIELARLVKKNDVKLKNDLQIVAYTLEEPPYFRSSQMGSFIHAKSLHDQRKSVEFMLSVEMIGYFSDEVFSQSYPSRLLHLYYPFRGDFIALIGGLKEYWSIRKVKDRFARASDMGLYSMNAPKFIPGIDYSDHLNYWNFGYNAYMLTDTSFYRNSNYHQETDTWETLNFEKMASVVNGIVGLVHD